MTFALSTANALLLGVTVISVGVLAIATAVALADARAKRRADAEGRAVELELEASLKSLERPLHKLLPETESLVEELRGAGTAEQFDLRLKNSDKRSRDLDGAVAHLRQVHDSMMAMRVDSLERLSVETESNIDRVVRLFRLRRELEDLRRERDDWK